MLLAKIVTSQVSEENRIRLANELRSIVQRISDIEKSCQIYVFGSFLRADFFTTSDIDLAVIIPDRVKTMDFLDLFYLNKPKFSWPMDLLVFQKTTFDKKKNIGGVCFVVHNEGKSLYPEWSLYDESVQTEV